MTDPRGVAIVCDYLLDYLGGAQTALLEQARALAADGYRVTLIAPEGRGSVDRLDEVRLLRVPSRGTLPGLRLPLIRNTAGLRARLRRWFLDHRIEVVHLHSEFGLAAAAIQVAGELGIPVAHTVHTFFWQTEFPAQRALGAAVGGFHRWLTRWPSDDPPQPLADRSGDAALRAMTWRIARRADVVVSPSGHQAERLRAAGLGRVEIIPNTLTGQPEPTDPPHPYRPVKIIWVGRCGPEKRLLPFVRAAVRAIERVGAGLLSITVVGEGEQLATARRIAGNHAEIRFLGRRPHAEVVRLIGDHHLLALTSYGFDNQPMSIAEAILAGRGVLYCDPRLTEGTTGDRDHPTAGILTDGPDETSLTNRMVELAEHPELVSAACRAARSARVTFEPETFRTKINKLYRSLRPWSSSESGWCSP